MHHFLLKTFDPIVNFIKKIVTYEKNYSISTFFETKERELKLEEKCLQPLIGDSDEVVVYGFGSCLYYEVSQALQKKYPKVDLWSSYHFPVIKIDKIPFNFKNIMARLTSSLNDARDYKAILTSLVIENYNRSCHGQPLIPLLFCIGLEEDNKIIELDSKKVAQTHTGSSINTYFGPLISSVTEKELRRCYKIYTEAPVKLKSIAAQTFKFVKVKQSATDKDLYTLEQLPAFWEQLFWEKAWRDRKHGKTFDKHPKQYEWRKILNQAAVDYGSIIHFFRDEKYLEENGEVIINTLTSSAS